MTSTDLPPSGYLQALGDRRYRRSALKVALVIGSLLFAINHGPALVSGAMTPTRWFSALLTFAVPYAVNVHGRWSQGRKPTRPHDKVLK